MHKVYENDDLMMYFQKRYCHCCGNVLQRKRTERIVRKGDPEHGVYCTIGTGYKPYGDILVIGEEYYCPSCNKSFSCDRQGKVSDAQKHFQKKIISEEEISLVENNSTVSAVQNIKKFRWLLFIPIIGALICHFYIFNGKLSEKTNNKDGAKLLLSSTIVLIGVALAIKIVLGFFTDIDFLNKYQSIIMLIPSLLSFNLPVMWYINHNLL